MAALKRASLYVMAVFYLVAGVNHFITPGFYLIMMPPYLPWHVPLVYISGVVEILLAVLLIPLLTRTYAAWGIILLLIAVFPANVYMAQMNGVTHGLAPVLVWLRLPFQLVLIAWAYWHTRE